MRLEGTLDAEHTLHRTLGLHVALVQAVRLEGGVQQGKDVAVPPAALPLLRLLPPHHHRLRR